MYLKEDYKNYNIGEVNVIIAGGSALALKYDYRATVDIDADIQFKGKVSETIKRVSHDCKIYGDWINQDFMKSYSYSRRINEDAVYVITLQGYMKIYVVSDITQLAMKINSGRNKDLKDIRFLSEKCIEENYRFSDVKQKYAYLYGKTIMKSRPESVCKALFRRSKRL